MPLFLTITWYNNTIKVTLNWFTSFDNLVAKLWVYTIQKESLTWNIYTFLDVTCKIKIQGENMSEFVANLDSTYGNGTLTLNISSISIWKEELTGRITAMLWSKTRSYTVQISSHKCDKSLTLNISCNSIWKRRQGEVHSGVYSRLDVIQSNASHTSVVAPNLKYLMFILKNKIQATRYHLSTCNTERNTLKYEVHSTVV